MAEAIRPRSKSEKVKPKRNKVKEKEKYAEDELDKLNTLHGECEKDVQIIPECTPKDYKENVNIIPQFTPKDCIQNIDIPESNLQTEEDIVSAKTTTDKRNLEKQTAISNVQSAILPSISQESNFEDLNRELHHFKPFFKSQKDLDQLKQNEEVTLTKEFSSPLPSAPQMCEEDLNSSLFHSPRLKTPNSLVRQRCSEDIQELPIESLQLLEPVSPVKTLTIKPYTEEQLLSLYNNIQLEEKENVITAFLEHEKNVTQNQFYENVLNYLRARTNLNGTEKEIKALFNDYKKQKEGIWTFEEHTLTEEGTCEDDQLLSVNYTHETATYQPEIASHISKKLKQIRETIFESHSLHVHSAEMSKLEVENYLQRVFTSCSVFTSLPKNGPTSCKFSDHDKDFAEHVHHLKTCISILMLFCRRNVQNSVFVREVKSWLSDAVAILLRVATARDHLFILNHLMRCPTGVGDWGAQFIQIVPPAVDGTKDLFGSSELDYLVTVLAILLQSPKEREHFLRHFKNIVNSSEAENPGDSSWIIVDSSGEDEEDSTEIWHYFNENDIIQFLNQVPFDAMFRHILLIESEVSLKYDVSKASQHSLMKLFAFCTLLLKIFQEGLRTYYQARFKGVVKRLSRLIRHTVHYVTDHWRGFVEWCQREGRITTLEDNAMAMRLQVEYDEFFENAVRTVFLSPRCGAWQFLAVIPYTCVSLDRLWRIAFKLHVGFEETPPPAPPEEDWPLLLRCEDTRGRLQDRLASLADSEAYYLLTALANMAIVRPRKERTFIEAIVSNLFETTLVHEDLRTSFNRTGRDLFLAITAAHSFTITTLLSEIQEKLSAVGSLSLYLFRFLCLDAWHPTEDDLQCLSYWLLYTPPPSLESQLARIVIAKMNWGFEPHGRALALPRTMHERIALLVVEVSLKLHSKMGQGNLLTEGVKQVTSVVYAPSPEQVFSKWCWSLLSQLHLHQLSQPEAEVRSVLANQSLVLRGIGDPSTSPSLAVLKKGLDAKHPLSLFAAMLMSSWGHSVPEICQHAPESLEAMVWQGHCDAALTVLSLISPLFFNQHEDLVSDARFIKTLQCILSSDQTYVNLAKSYITSDPRGRSVLGLFQGLIADQVLGFHRFHLEGRSSVIKFWIDFLVLVPNWRNNGSVLRLVDLLCQMALFDPPSWRLLKEVFGDQRKVLSGEKGGQGGLGGLLNWVSSSGGSCSLLGRSLAPEVPWFALCVLTCEAQEEMASGVWKALLRHLHSNPGVALEVALKAVCSDLQVDPVPSNALSLYRLGQQLIDLPCDSPAFPATAQTFLTFHLARTPPQAGQYDCSSVIYKFYEGFINSNFLKKLKYKMADAFTLWESELAKERGSEREADPASPESKRKVVFLSQLVSTLSTMSTWMEETKLYETGLYIPALPPQLMPKKLLLLFQENWEIWPELMDRSSLELDLEAHVRVWRSQQDSGSSPSPPPSAGSSPSHLSDAKEDLRRASPSPSEAILRRVGEYDPPKAPPSLPSLSHRPPRRHEHSTLNRQSVLYDIHRFTSLVTDHSRMVLLRSKEMCALDCVFAEFLPQLWSNPVTKAVLTATCKPSRNAQYSECSGSASIVVEYCEKRVNEGAKARLDQNREQHLGLFSIATQAPPLQLCEAALHLDELVNNVVRWHQNLPHDADDRVSLTGYGRDLFFHFVQLSSEDTTAYPPAKQLITSCADALGQEFLHGHTDCQENLARQVLQLTPQLGALLSPHFSPLVTPVDVYLASYASVSASVAAQPDLCFMLLSKFEMEAWLREKNVGAEERSRLIRSVCESLASILALGNESSVMCLELYRVHLRALLSYNFPEHFEEVLMLLLDMSVGSADCGDVRRNLWYDLLNMLAKGAARFSPEMTSAEVTENIRRFAQSQTVLGPLVVKDMMNQLSSYFLRQRFEFGLYGLYSKYKSDVTPVSILLGMTSFIYVITASHTSQHVDVDSFAKDIWCRLEELWAAWISPLGGQRRASCPQWIQELMLDKRVLLPWTPGDVSGPAQVVGMFTSTLAFFHHTFVGCKVLSMFLEYYHCTYATPAVKDHILGVLHSQMAALPWHHLSPSLKDLEIFSKIVNEFLPECHSFVGNIFIQISWSKVVQSFVDASESPKDSPTELTRANGSEPSGSSSSVVKLHVMLINILVRICSEPSVRQSGLLHPLLVSASDFDWRYVDGKALESVLNWLVMSCDPRIALQMNNRNPIDVSLIQLLQVAAGYDPSVSGPPHRSGPLKRRLLVRALCRLLTTAATRHKALLSARRALFGDTFASLLSHMERVVQGLSEKTQFEEGSHLCSEAVNLIGGGASPPVLQEVCRDALLEWLKKTPHHARAFLLPLAASISKGVLHLHHRSPLLEACVAAVFSEADGLSEEDFLSWMDVVRVLSFPLTNPMPMLTFAAQENHLLVIYVHTKWRFYVRRCSEGDHLFILTNLMELLVTLTPEERCENWLLLLVGEAVDLIHLDVEKGESYDTSWRHTLTLADLLTSWGEDRASSGILAAIGLGRKSPLSARVRLFCKIMSTFLRSQLLSPGFFSAINEHKRKSSDIDEKGEASSECSMKPLQQLLSLRSQAPYAPHAPALDHALEFIQDCRHHILDARALFDSLLGRLFPPGAVTLQMRKTPRAPNYPVMPEADLSRGLGAPEGIGNTLGEIEFSRI